MPAASQTKPKPKKRTTAVPAAEYWPADHVERRSVKDLLAYPRNARVHSEEQVDQIAASMKANGWTIPMLVDEQGVIIAGHGRLMAANKLGIKTVPVMIARGWSEDQKRSYRLADNQIPMNASWDRDILRVELNELKAGNFPIALAGFTGLQLVQFTSGIPAGRDAEATPEPPAVPVSKRGDIWLLGNHRLMCGDATSANDVERLLDGAKPHLMVTDAPYGVEYDAGWRNEMMPQKTDPSRQRDGSGRAIGQVHNDDNADWTEAWKLFPGDVVYQWHASLRAIDTQASLRMAGFEVRSQIIWAKQMFAIGRGDYHVQHEPCWYAVRKGKRGHWNGDRSQSTLWQIDKPDKSETGHSTQKPIECMKRPIENNSQPGDAVYDPFVGSFTTGIACEMTGRRCYAMEISEQYVDVGIVRWQELTDKEAVLDGTKLTYEQIKKQRTVRPKARKRAQASAALA